MLASGEQILPQLHLRWSGFRRVRRQVCRRLRNRFLKLGLKDFASYRTYLLDHPDEWLVVDACCRITISRFYRDAPVFEQLSQALPTLTNTVRTREKRQKHSLLVCWLCFWRRSLYPTPSKNRDKPVQFCHDFC